MKIKLTHSIPETGLYAGLIYELPEKEAQEIVAKDFGFVFDGNDFEVTEVGDKYKTFVESPKRKVVK